MSGSRDFGAGSPRQSIGSQRHPIAPDTRRISAMSDAPLGAGDQFTPIQAKPDAIAQGVLARVDAVLPQAGGPYPLHAARCRNRRHLHTRPRGLGPCPRRSRIRHARSVRGMSKIGPHDARPSRPRILGEHRSPRQLPPSERRILKNLLNLRSYSTDVFALKLPATV